MSDHWKRNGLVKPQSIVVCAANKHIETGLIICGARHWDKIMCDVADLLPDSIRLSRKWKQGFINQFGEFLTRKEALKIVRENGQRFDLDRNGATDELYSEGLY